MGGVARRKFLKMAALAAGAPRGSVFSQGKESPSTSKAILVRGGKDRENKDHTIGVSHTSYKVLTAETAGAMFVMEQANASKGGPPLHLHHGQDELFYVVEGDYDVQVGADRFHLKAGDCVLGPREVPHAWAFVGSGTGRMVISYCPAGKMEAFFNDRERRLGAGNHAYMHTPEDAATMLAYGMVLLGAPLKIEA